MVAHSIENHLIKYLFENFPGEAAGILNGLELKEIMDYLQDMPLPVAVRVFLRLEQNVASQVLSELPDDYFIQLFSQLDPFAATLLISRLDGDKITSRLRLIEEKRAAEIRELMTYPAESAGFLMDTKITTFYPQSQVSDVLTRLRELKDKTVLTVYVVDDLGRLKGKIPLQKIAISSPLQTMEDLMEPSKSIHAMSPQEEVVELLKDGKIFSIPVVDLNDVVLGVIRYDRLIEATKQDATEDVQMMFGAGREERALSKVSFAVRKRLPWLEINLATAFLAASVVGMFEDTIARITVLAVFLPVVAGQSGNTGSQALAVTIRGLALREIRVGQWWQVARKEAAVGFINGLAVSLTTAIIVYFWASSFGLSVVIAVSMVFSMVIAGFSGAVIPLFLKSIGQDPAQSSSIVLTTVTDIVGFLSFLGLATGLGSMLGIV